MTRLLQQLASLKIATAAALLLASAASYAVPITYSNRSSFEAALDLVLTDDYSLDAYRQGDLSNFANTDIHSDSQMSSIFGETDYEATGISNNNVFFVSSAANLVYCAGCNGSFRLSFTTTSIGDIDGVYGVGFDYWNSQGLYHAFVTYGDDSTQDFALGALGGFGNTGLFFGITSDLSIKAIHLGLAGGASTKNGHFGIDNLSIGAAQVPEPTALTLMGLGLVGFGCSRRVHRAHG